MDLVSVSISGLNNEYLTLISSLIDNLIIFSLIVLFIIFYFEKNENKRKKLFIAVILAFLIGTMVKEIYQIERPCIALDSKIKCSLGYSFPSIHSIVMFTLALGFLDDKKYILIIVLGVFVAFTRIYLGIHTFFDVAGALVLSTIVYGIVDYYWRKRK
ncbi:MAG: phosphatase PAP2 family protein [Candidatus Micrarchaeia archaeon]